MCQSKCSLTEALENRGLDSCEERGTLLHVISSAQNLNMARLKSEVYGTIVNKTEHWLSMINTTASPKVPVKNSAELVESAFK